MSFVTDFRIIGQKMLSGKSSYSQSTVNGWAWNGTNVYWPTDLITTDPNGKILYQDCYYEGEEARLFVQGNKLNGSVITGVNLCMYKKDGTLIKKSPLIRDDDTSTGYNGIDFVSLFELSEYNVDKGTPDYGTRPYYPFVFGDSNLFVKHYYFSEIAYQFKQEGNILDFAQVGTRPSFHNFLSPFGAGDYILKTDSFGPSTSPTYFNHPLKAVAVVLSAGGGGGKGAAWSTTNAGGGGGAMAFYVLNVRDYSFNIHVGSGGSGGGYDEAGGAGGNSYIELSDGTEIITLYGGKGGTTSGGAGGSYHMNPSIAFSRTGLTPILGGFPLGGGRGGGEAANGESISVDFEIGPGDNCTDTFGGKGGSGGDRQGGGGGSLGNGGDVVTSYGADGNPGKNGGGGAGGANLAFDGGSGGRGGDGVCYIYV